MPVERDLAIQQLQALAGVPGALRIITNEHCCPGGPLPRTPEEQAACNAHVLPATHPEHFVLHDVIGVEGPDAAGRYRAVSAEGDWCVGAPEDLLARLQEWMQR